MRRRLKGTVCIVLGTLLVLSALLLTGYNLITEEQATQSTNDALEQLEDKIPQVEESDLMPGISNHPEVALPDYVQNPDMEMPTVNINGWNYIGVLEIYELGLSLPVVTEWSYSALRVAPARYCGSAYTNDLVIAAHNYNTHFGNIKELKPGAELQFTDVDGNVFSYEVVAVEVLVPTAVEEMTSGEWDLSLFTCTVGGSYRVTVRCNLRE